MKKISYPSGYQDLNRLQMNNPTPRGLAAWLPQVEIYMNYESLTLVEKELLGPPKTPTHLFWGTNRNEILSSIAKSFKK